MNKKVIDNLDKQTCIFIEKKVLADFLKENKVIKTEKDE